MGESGSGKSTLVNLLTFLLKPVSGEILVDNKIVNDFNEIRKYQNLFSITSQDTYLVDGTIKDNIVFGSSDKIDKRRLDKAINFANLDLMIGDLSKKE